MIVAADRHPVSGNAPARERTYSRIPGPKACLKTVPQSTHLAA